MESGDTLTCASLEFLPSKLSIFKLVSSFRAATSSSPLRPMLFSLICTHHATSKMSVLTFHAEKRQESDDTVACQFHAHASSMCTRAHTHLCHVGYAQCAFGIAYDARPPGAYFVPKSVHHMAMIQRCVHLPACALGKTTECCVLCGMSWAGGIVVLADTACFGAVALCPRRTFSIFYGVCTGASAQRCAL